MNNLDKKDKDIKYANWQLFFLNNLDIFIEDYLGIKLKYFQKQILLDIWKDDISFIVASRGLSKSFTVGLAANALALLLPGIQIGIASLTIGQSNKIISEKINTLISSEKRGLSPVMKQLRKDGYIVFKNDKTTDALIVEYGNGSKIFAVNCGEGGRGSRTNISILDECALVKKSDYSAIVEPMLEPYSYNGLYLEPKQIFMTSARNKSNWCWRYLVNVVNGHYKDKHVNYGFFAGDIYTAIANKIQTKKQYITRKENTDNRIFEQEYLNIWQGEADGCLFSYEMFTDLQSIKDAFYPRSVVEIISKQPNKYNFKDSQIRYISCDIALASGDENDNSVIVLGNLDLNTMQKMLSILNQ